MIHVAPNIEIDPSEIKFSTSRSSGPGGQHVNKVSTKVTLQFDVENSTCLDEDQKTKVFKKLGNRINKNGVLLIDCQEHKSQLANKEAAVIKFQQLMTLAFEKRKYRIKTRIPNAVKQKRLDAKKRKSQIKQSRQKFY